MSTQELPKQISVQKGIELIKQGHALIFFTRGTTQKLSRSEAGDPAPYMWVGSTDIAPTWKEESELGAIIKAHRWCIDL